MCPVVLPTYTVPSPSPTDLARSRDHFPRRRAAKLNPLANPADLHLHIASALGIVPTVPIIVEPDVVAVPKSPFQYRCDSALVLEYTPHES